MGTYKLKGVAGTQCVMQINSNNFASRTFPASCASSKAEKVRVWWGSRCNATVSKQVAALCYCFVRGLRLCLSGFAAGVSWKRAHLHSDAAAALMGCIDREWMVV